MFTVHMRKFTGVYCLRKFTGVYCSHEEDYRCLLFTVGSLPVFTVHRRKFTRCLVIIERSLPCVYWS